MNHTDYVNMNIREASFTCTEKEPTYKVTIGVGVAHNILQGCQEKAVNRLLKWAKSINPFNKTIRLETNNGQITVLKRDKITFIHCEKE